MDSKLSNLYNWYNYSNGNELALQFYTCFIDNIAAFPFKEDFSIALCTRDTVHLFIDIFDVYRGQDYSVENNKKVRAFLEASHCPAYQGFEDMNGYLPHLTIDNVEENISQVHINIIRGQYRKGGTWMSYESRPDVQKLKTEESIEGLIHALCYKAPSMKSEYYTVRKEAEDALVSLGTVVFEPLIAALRDSNSEMRSAAASALGKLGDTRAVEPLIAVLEDSESNARERATIALGKLGDVRAVEPLIPALRDSNSDVRSAAATALGRLGDVRAVEPLTVALADMDRYVQKSVTEALAKIRQKPM